MNNKDILKLILTLVCILLPLSAALRFPLSHTNTKERKKTEDVKMPPIKFNVQCRCGKVKGAVQCLETAPPLRLVCYCKDCRGYYSALNHMAHSHGNPPSAQLDAWGGVDWTSVYPRDITITQGNDLLVTTKIREKSPIRQVYTSCCDTPMFRFGGASVLMNTNLIQEEDAKMDVRFRIIGRDALKGSGDNTATKPKISWSVPFSWLWVMGGRIKKDLMDPMPMTLKPSEEVEVLKDFKAG